MSSSLKAKLGEAALLFGSLLLVIGIVELAVRMSGLADPRPTGYAPVNTRRKDMRPTNVNGYRDIERVVPKPAGVRRILSLGDSFAWGASIEYDDTYAQRLERTLVRRRGEPWQVVQLALPGLATVDQASQLLDEGFAYGPEVVLLGFVLNDSEDQNAAEKRRAQDWVDEKKDRQARRGLLHRSALYRLVSGRLRATSETRRRVEAYRSQFRDDYPGWVACRKALRTMGSACRERGIPFVVVIFPLLGNALDESYPFAEIHQKVSAAAAEAGARVVDLLPAYRGLRWDVLVVDGADDEHPNEVAHRIAANAILPVLDEVIPTP